MSSDEPRQRKSYYLPESIVNYVRDISIDRTTQERKKVSESEIATEIFEDYRKRQNKKKGK